MISIPGMSEQQLLSLLRDVCSDPVRFRYTFFKRDPHPAQDVILADRSQFKTIAAGRRFGKALDINTPILTTSGWKTIGSLTLEDKVFDESGNPVVINWIGEVRYDRPCYRLTFSDGETIVADADHEWISEDKQYRKQTARKDGYGDPTKWKPKKVTTEEIYQNYLVPRKDGKSENNHSIRVCKPLQFQERELLIDPYVLGAWLGDGTSRNGNITTKDPEILEEIERRGYKIGQSKYNIDNNHITYTIYLEEIWGIGGRSHKGAHKSIADHLKELGIIKNKHIPENYLFASYKQRLDLLRGLMDTDGTVSTQGHCEFCTTNSRLAEQVRYLVISLGIKCVIYTHDATLNGRVVGDKYRICFSTPQTVCLLPRKAERIKTKYREEIYRRFIVNVEPVPTRPVRCIEVNNESHLFLAGKHLVPTHNSVLMADDINWYAITKPETFQFGFAPTYDQTRIIFGECVNQLQSSCLSFMVKSITKTPFPRIELVNGSAVEFRSTKNPENIRGHKAHRAILDEAAFIPDDVVSSVIEPMLMDYNGSYVKISTPFGVGNHFYKTWVLGQPDPDDPAHSKVQGYSSYQFTSLDNPHISHEYLEKKRKEYGSESIIFRTEYLAQFIEDQNNVFRYADIVGNVDNTILLQPKLDRARGIYPQGEMYHNYIIGLDIAKHSDYTAIIVLDVTSWPYNVVYCDRYQQVPYSVITEEAIILKTCFNDADIIVDSTGVGDAVYEELELYGAFGYVFTKKSKFHLIEVLQKAMENDLTIGKIADIRYPQLHELIKELQYFEYRRNQDTKNIKMEAKSGMHDDLVIALALAVYGACEAPELSRLPEEGEWEFF